MLEEAGNDPAKLVFVSSLQADVKAERSALQKLAAIATPAMSHEQELLLKKLQAQDTRAQELAKASPKAVAQLLSSQMMHVLYSPDANRAEGALKNAELILQALNRHPAKEAILAELNKLSPTLLAAYEQVDAQIKSCPIIRKELDEKLQQISQLTDHKEISAKLIELKKEMEAKWPSRFVPLRALYNMDSTEETRFEQLNAERASHLVSGGSPDDFRARFEQVYPKYLWRQLVLNAGEFMSWGSDDPRKATFTMAKDRLRGSEIPGIQTALQMYEDFNLRPKNKPADKLEKECRYLSGNTLDSVFSISNYTDQALSLAPHIPGVHAETIEALQRSQQQLEKIAVAFRNALLDSLKPEAKARRDALETELRELRRTGAPTAEILKRESEKRLITQEGLDLQKAVGVILQHGAPFFRAYCEVFASIERMQNEWQDALDSMSEEKKKSATDATSLDPSAQAALVKLKEDMGTANTPTLSEGWNGIYGGFLRLQAGSLPQQVEGLLQHTPENAPSRAGLADLNHQLRSIQDSVNKQKLP
jgi:hypothetical protein